MVFATSIPFIMSMNVTIIYHGIPMMVIFLMLMIWTSICPAIRIASPKNDSDIIRQFRTSFLQTDLLELEEKVSPASSED